MNDSLIIYSYGLFGGQLYGNQSTMLQCKSGGWFLSWYVNSVGIIGKTSAFFLGIDLQFKSSKISFSSCIVKFGWRLRWQQPSLNFFKVPQDSLNNLFFQWSEDLLQIPLYSKTTFSKRKASLYFKVSCFLNKKRFLSSKNIHQTIYFTDLIDTRLMKVIGFKLPVVFIAFYLMFWRIIMYIIIKLILANLNQ